MFNVRRSAAVVALGLSLAFPVYSYSATSDVASTASPLVTFSAARQRGHFTIECAPRTRLAASQNAWIVECNRLGRAALDRATASHTIVPVTGTAFISAAELPSSCALNHEQITFRLQRSFPMRAQGG